MILYLLLTPLLVIWLSKRWSWIDKISPMTVLYIIGLLVANLLPIGPQAQSINTWVGNIAVPLAIPLMLMGCSLSRRGAAGAAKAFLCGFVSVVVVVVAGFFLFRGNSDSRSFAQVAAVGTGLYTGGIPNGAPIKQAVGMSNETYLYLTSYDLIVTGLYLIFIIFFGKKVFRRLLPAPQQPLPSTGTAKDDAKVKATPGVIALVIGLTLAIAAISYLMASLLSRDGDVNMTVLILALTTLAIAASFLKPVRRQQISFNLGLYCVYVFCLSIATSCNIRQMDLLGSLNILYYIGFIIFGSLVLQFLLARLFKVDSDTVMVSSVALINSPPFVPLVAALLGNKDIVVTGIAIGLLGYMLGNYLGIAIFQVLSMA